MNKLILAILACTLVGCGHPCESGFEKHPVALCLNSTYQDNGLDIYYEPCDYRCVKKQPRKTK